MLASSFDTLSTGFDSGFSSAGGLTSSDRLSDPIIAPTGREQMKTMQNHVCFYLKPVVLDKNENF